MVINIIDWVDKAIGLQQRGRLKILEVRLNMIPRILYIGELH